MCVYTAKCRPSCAHRQLVVVVLAPDALLAELAERNALSQHTSSFTGSLSLKKPAPTGRLKRETPASHRRTRAGMLIGGFSGRGRQW